MKMIRGCKIRINISLKIWIINWGYKYLLSFWNLTCGIEFSFISSFLFNLSKTALIWDFMFDHLGEFLCLPHHFLCFRCDFCVGVIIWVSWSRHGSWIEPVAVARYWFCKAVARVPHLIRLIVWIGHRWTCRVTTCIHYLLAIPWWIKWWF